jgi:hypothetical protein
MLTIFFFLFSSSSVCHLSSILDYTSFKEELDTGIYISAFFVDPIKKDYADQVSQLAECITSFFINILNNIFILLAYTAIIVVFALVPEMEKILKEASKQHLLESPYVWIGNFAILDVNHNIYLFSCL